MTDRALILFNTRILTYKKPYGAMKPGKLITNIDISRRLAPTEVIFLLRREEEGNLFAYDRYQMLWTGLEGSYDKYHIELEMENKGLYFYYFELKFSDGTKYYGAKKAFNGGEGKEYGATEELIPFSFTVYEYKYEFPEWFGKGITYQIFPDRFARSSLKPPINSDPDKHLLAESELSKPPEKIVYPNGDVPNNEYYGGNLQGIIEKLPYISSLGVSTIYLNPIFVSATNHRYDTSDYMSIDPILGDDADFCELCEKASELGIKIMLDGVFNHTGDDSKYFDKYAKYGGGACEGESSPYYKWYTFKNFPDDYECWWNIKILPSVNEDEPSYREYIYNGDSSVIKKWLTLGASAWRLDVADELPDDFIAEFAAKAKEIKPDCFILGEVWEDASYKVAYGKRRQYLLGDELDGVMNYPFRTACIDFLLGGDASAYAEEMSSIAENYPPEILKSLMNTLGTHDTPRIINVLGVNKEDIPQTLAERRLYKLSPVERERGKVRLRLGLLLLMTLCGSPSMYYGDEMGCEGFEDPFNRRYLLFEEADKEISDYYLKLVEIRKSFGVFSTSAPKYCEAQGGRLVLSWNKSLFLVINRDNKPESFSIKTNRRSLFALISKQKYTAVDDRVEFTLPAMTGEILSMRG